jgi:hypothetical protein
MWPAIKTFFKSLSARWQKYQREQERRQLLQQSNAQRGERVDRLAKRIMSLPSEDRDRMIQMAEKMAEDVRKRKKERNP